MEESSQKEWMAYLKRHSAELAVLPEALLQAMGNLDDSSLQGLAKVAPAVYEQPREPIEELLRCHRDFLAWRLALRKQRSRLQYAAKQWTTTPAELDALFRVVRMLSLGRYSPGQDAWLAGLQIWRGASRVAYKACEVKITATDTSHERFSHYASLVGKREGLQDIPAHRWLAARRGAKEGVLTLELNFDTEALVAQAEVHRQALGEVVSEREASSILEELVLQDLPTWLKTEADRRAQEHVFALAQRQLRALLDAPPLKSKHLGAIYLSRKNTPAGVVILDSTGQLRQHASFMLEERSSERIATFLERHPCDALALPIRASARDELQALHNALERQHNDIHHVKAAGMKQALTPLKREFPTLDPACAAAIVLGRRLLQPFQEWSRLDPTKLGIAEYQEFLDLPSLRSALEREILFAKAAQRRHTSARQTRRPNSPKRPALTTPKRNLVGSMADLKPGMWLPGRVSNLTDFGAFVNIGLSQDGLVHLSQISDNFVKHPSEVVQIGESVRVRVLSADLKQRRISLSMRTEDKPRPRRQNQKRADALQALENLFKK